MTECDWQFEGMGMPGLLGEWLDAAGIDGHSPGYGHADGDPETFPDLPA